MPRHTRDGEILTYGTGGYAARGHISQAALQAAAQDFMHNDTVIVHAVTHVWWRFIPNAEWPDEGLIGVYADAVPGSRGAFRVTMEITL